MFGSALLFYNINKAQLQNPIIASIFDMPVSLFVYMLVFFVLGFLIYAFLYGAIGSTASKLEDISTMVLPVTFLFHYCFYDCSALDDRRQRKLRVDEGIFVYSVHFAYGYVLRGSV